MYCQHCGPCHCKAKPRGIEIFRVEQGWTATYSGKSGCYIYPGASAQEALQRLLDAMILQLTAPDLR